MNQANSRRGKIHRFFAHFANCTKTFALYPLPVALRAARMNQSNLGRRDISFATAYLTGDFTSLSALFSQPFRFATSATELSDPGWKRVDVFTADFATNCNPSFHDGSGNQSRKLGMFETVALGTQNFNVIFALAKQWTARIGKFVMAMQIFSRSTAFTISQEFSSPLSSNFDQWRTFCDATFPHWIRATSVCFSRASKRAIKQLGASFFAFSNIARSALENGIADWANQFNLPLGHWHNLCIAKTLNNFNKF